MLVLLPEVVERMGIKPPEFGVKRWDAKSNQEAVEWVESRPEH
jgi:hypothetical protein